MIRLGHYLPNLVCINLYLNLHMYSSSLLDLILVSNPFSVLFTDVGAPLLEQVRYHLPVIGLLHHSSKPSTSYKRKIFLYDKGDFWLVQTMNYRLDWETMFGHNNVDTINVDIIAKTITDSEKRVTCIVDLATNSPIFQNLQS